MRIPDPLGYRFYRRWFGWTGWQAGRTRLISSRPVILPRWADDLGDIAVDLGRAARGQCLACGMRGQHKMACHGGVTLRGRLTQLADPLRRRVTLGPKRRWPR